MLKTKTWIIIISAIFLLCATALFFITFGRSTGSIANVYLDGESIYSIDLATVTAPFEKRIEASAGEYNTICFEPGRVCISDSSCKDRICVHTGYISSSSYPIVCLPHRLVIKIEKYAYESSLEFDSVTQ